MDLSDGSDVDDGDHVSQQINEEDLLGSSEDEDVTKDNGGFAIPDFSSPSRPLRKTTPAIETDEEILELALGDDEDGLGLELNASDDSLGISPVKVKVLSNRVSPQVTPTSSVNNHGLPSDGDSYAEGESEDHEDDSSETTKAAPVVDTGEDDDDEEKGQRSRFLSERHPQPPANANAGNKSGNFIESAQPIRTLGDHFKFGNQNNTFHYGGNWPRGGMRTRGNMQNHLQMRRGFRPNSQVHMMGHRNNHPHLSPRSQPIMGQLHHAPSRPDYRPAGPEIPVSQCSGQIFIDFNQPIQPKTNLVLAPQPPPKIPPPSTQDQSQAQEAKEPSTHDSNATTAPASPVVSPQQPTNPAEPSAGTPTISPQKQTVAIRPQQVQQPQAPPSEAVVSTPPNKNNNVSPNVVTGRSPRPSRHPFHNRNPVRQQRNPAFYSAQRAPFSPQHQQFPPHQQQQQFLPDQFPPQQAFPAQRPPIPPMRPPPQMFMPNQPPQMFPPPQPNLIPPNFGYVGGPAPGMMVRHPATQFDVNRFPNQGQQLMWGEQLPPPYCPPAQFQGMAPAGYFPPQQQQFQPPMNHFPMDHLQQYPQDPNMQMMGAGYAFPQQQQLLQQQNLQTVRPPVAVQDEVARIEKEIRREEERLRYERERRERRDSSEDERRRDDYRRTRSSGGSRRYSDSDSEDEDYRRSEKQRHYEKYHYVRRRRSVSRERPTSSPESQDAPPPSVDPKKAAELDKIIGETKKEMGIDDAYMAKIAEQKRLREEILRKKGNKKREADRELALKSLPNKPTIYVNPATFKGDLSQISKQVKSSIQGQEKATTSASVAAQAQKRKVSSATHKPNTILRKIVSSDGTLIRMEKLCKVMPQVRNVSSTRTLPHTSPYQGA